MPSKEIDPGQGSLWFVCHTPFHITLYDDLEHRHGVRLGHGECIIVSESDRSLYVRVLTSRGQVGFMDIGWWAPTREPVLIEVAS